MKLQNLLSAVAVVLALSAAASAQDSAFKAGQSVYVVVMTSSGQPDLSTENELKDEFAKQKTFKVAPSLQSADFVFLMLVEYDYNQVAVGAIAVGSGNIKSVAALVVPPDAYTQHKSDLDDLRDKALWQTSENKRFLHAGDLPKKIVKKFHANATPIKR
jgi:ABC-type glycerol-3-phosphate transport system substrate-binding protein